MARKKAIMETVGITEAISYIRVSTGEQADSGLGLESQRRRNAAYIEAQGWKLVGEFIDAGVSAKTLNRPGLVDALGALKPGRIMVATKLDRLTRTARDLDELTDSVLSNGGEWATVEGSYDTSTAMGRFMLRVVADIAQMEREVTAERTTAALAVKAANGERLGTTPLGYQTVRTDSGETVLELVADEQETVELARNLRASGLSLRAVAAELTQAGRKTKRGGKWAAETVNLLISPRYLEGIAA